MLVFVVINFVLIAKVIIIIIIIRLLLLLILLLLLLLLLLELLFRKYFIIIVSLLNFSNHFLSFTGLLLCPINPFDIARPSYLQVLSAADLSEVGRALVPSDVTVPYSFHGCFIYDNSVDRKKP